MPTISFKYLTDGDRSLVVVPKVASSTLETAFAHHLKWVALNEPGRQEAIDAGQRFYGVVRHPIDRWVAGVCQKYAPWFNKKDIPEEDMGYIESLMDGHAMSWFIENTPHDEHTQPQFWHWQPIPPDQHKLYKLERLQGLWDGLGIANPSPPAERHLNKATDRGHYKLVYDQVYCNLRGNPEYVRALYKYYEEDMAMWDWAE